MKVTYHGPHTGGVDVVDRATGFEHHFELGDSLELDDELVARLVEQEPDAWRVAGGAAAKVKATQKRLSARARREAAAAAAAAELVPEDDNTKDGV